VQAGFIIGVGLLVDTFLVRTVTVPALAVLIGRANWWPTLWGRRAIPLSVEEETELSEFESEIGDVPDDELLSLAVTNAPTWRPEAAVACHQVQNLV
jgi:hypothetical protein